MEEDLQIRQRFEWYAKRVKFKFIDDRFPEPENPTPVFPALDYTEVLPPLDTFVDHEFYSGPISSLREETIRLSLHIFFSLPARGLDTSGLKKRTRQTEMREAESASLTEVGTDYQYILNKTSNKGTAARKLFHRVVMSDDSEEMDLKETYHKMNDFVKGAKDRSRFFFKQATFLDEPFHVGSKETGLPENATKEAFKAILNPIMVLYRHLWGEHLHFSTDTASYEYSNQFDENDKTKYTAIPDFAVKENGEPLVCIEVKYPSINLDDPEACSDVFTQAVSHCICSGTPYGVLTDFLSTLCFKLELEEKDIEDVKNCTHGTNVDFEKGMFKFVKVRWYRVKHDAAVNTLACVLAAHIFNAREDMLLRRDEYRVLLSKLGAALQLTSRELKVRNRQSYNGFLKYLDRKRPQNLKKVKVTVEKNGITDVKTVNFYDMIPFEEPIRIIQEGESYNAQVLEINEDVFKKLTGNGEHAGDHPPASRYLLKFFDPVRGKKVHRNFTFTETSYRKFIKHTFFREFVVYEGLKSLWGKCIPRLYHSGICHLTDSNGHDIKFGGLFLIIEFIEGTPPDFSRQEVQQSARDALKAMHDLGAVHGDIDSRNMIQRGDQVFLLDFGSSSFEKPDKGYYNYLDDLKRKDIEGLENTIMKYLTNHPTSSSSL